MVEYTRDHRLEDFWQSPYVTVAEKNWKGDCDDISILGAYLSEKIGYEPIILSLWPARGEGHFITLFEKKTNGGIKYGCIDSAGFFHDPSSDSIEKIVKLINENKSPVEYPYTRFEKIYLNKVNNPRKNWRTHKGNLFRLLDPTNYETQKDISKNIRRIEEELSKNKKIQEELEKMGEESKERILEMTK